MPVLRKRSQDFNNNNNNSKTNQTNGLYIHSSPPRVLQQNSAHIKQLIRSGDIEKLQQLIYDGHGKKLIGEYSADYRTRTFLKTVPTIMSKISLVHDAVNSGRLEELQSILDDEGDKKRKLVMAKDDAGVGLLHKAVYYDLKDIYKYLIDNFPFIVSMKDAEGRTAYHYTPMCRDTAGVQKLLINAGADPNVLDNRQHSAKYYANHLQELELPCGHQKSTNVGGSTKMNNGGQENQQGGLNFKKSNIRIWIHQRNLTNLQQVVWEGHGSKLLVEHSNNSKVKKVLEAVPHIMGLIKDIHTDVINNEVENLKNRIQPPLPPIVLSGKDSNGLTPLHKAAGLGRQEIAEFIVDQYPKSVQLIDNDGRTPLHYAALVKDNGKMMEFLLANGADESVLDNRQKTAAYYKTRHSEIDSKNLQTIPECPRTAKESFLSTFDWNLLNTNSGGEEQRKSYKKSQENLVEVDTNKNDKDIENEVNKNGDSNGNHHDDDDDNNNNEEKTENNDKDKQNDNEEIVHETNEPEIVPETVKIPDNDQNDKEPEPDNSNNNEMREETGEIEGDDDKVTEKTEENIEEQTNDVDRDDDVKHSRPASVSKSRPNSTKQSRPGSKMVEEAINKIDEAVNDEDHHHQQEEEQEEAEEEEEQEEEKKEEATEIEPEGVIEGIVNGENEVETLNEEGQNSTADDNDDDDDVVRKLIEDGNMEQLAALVLNGDGERLIGRKTDNVELQSFLDNVPVYMSKIHRIHQAARNGSLRELQAALDRRKFAIAKDKLSPNGASPLHTAVVFGNTNIVRYLAGRFPETAEVIDDNGRTPLHYAAVLADNGHYFNLLVHLGSDTRIEDKFGHTPEYYRTNQDEFSHRSLLKDYGVEESASDAILSDKDNLPQHNNNNNNNNNGEKDMPFFATEEGRYLASSLGDPLIKGLTEVANKRPDDPIAYLATYLYNFANNKQNKPSSSSIRGRIIQDQQQQQQTVITGAPQQLDDDDNNSIPASIDVVTVDPDENDDRDEDTAFNNTTRDEHGQSMLHFAASRPHGRNALFQLLIDTDINIAYRDELYRTARDISVQANLRENTVEIDRYVIHIATNGDTDKLVELLLEGYDHITDIIDEDQVPIVELVVQHNQTDTVSFLQSILAFEEKRERVHHAIRLGSINDVTELLADENDTGSGKLLAIGKNSYGRCTLHVAVLCQQEEIVDYLANTFPETLQLGDNLERTALHYAMGVEKMETISRVLIKAGAKRVAKDLKGRQPTYYFLNKSEILRLQEEESTF